jgi:hypothetical protein
MAKIIILIKFFTVKLTGLHFTKDAMKRFDEHSKWNQKEPFELVDIVDMGERVKDMNIVSLSQANFFFFKALQETDKSLMDVMLHQV